MQALRLIHRCPIVWTTLILVLLAATLTAGQRRHKWWLSEEDKTELALTDAQSEELEAIFQASRPDLRALIRELKHEEEALSDLIETMQVEGEVTRQIDRVESVRSALSRTRILMLYRMHKELTAEQREALRAWRQRHQSHDTHPSSCR